MSEKVFDKKNRWRNKVVAFRVSLGEWDEIEDRVKLSGCKSKQDYIISCLLNHKIEAVGNPLMLLQFKKDLNQIKTKLEDIDDVNQLSSGIVDSIKTMEEILKAFADKEKLLQKEETKDERKKIILRRP